METYKSSKKVKAILFFIWLVVTFIVVGFSFKNLSAASDFRVFIGFISLVILAFVTIVTRCFTKVIELYKIWKYNKTIKK